MASAARVTSLDDYRARRANANVATTQIGMSMTHSGKASALPTRIDPLHALLVIDYCLFTAMDALDIHLNSKGV